MTFVKIANNKINKLELRSGELQASSLFIYSTKIYKDTTQLHTITSIAFGYSASIGLLDLRVGGTNS